MPFAPEMTIAHKQTPQAKAASIRIGPYTEADAARLFPFHPADPALGFLDAGVVPLFTAETPEPHLAHMLSADTAWGVWKDQELAGFALLRQKFGFGDVPEYSIVLGSNHRRRGIGSLVTAGVIQSAFTEGVLASAIEYSPSQAHAIETAIHPQNTPFQKLCVSFGFTAIGAETVDGFTWIKYSLPAPGKEAEYGLRAYVGLKRDRALNRFTYTT